MAKGYKDPITGLEIKPGFVSPRDEAQKERIKRLRSELEAIQSIGRRATQGHDADCPCASCLMTNQATKALLRN